MEHAVEDYYDMPVDMLPSANFAGRPTSEISMLDGLWTMILNSSSSEDEDDDQDDDGTLVPDLQTPTKPLPSQALRPRSPDTPKITITSPFFEASRPRARSLSNDVKILDRPRRGSSKHAKITARPRLRNKAQTAPPGAFSGLPSPPPEPRRTFSARLDYSNSVKKRQPPTCSWIESSLRIEDSLRIESSLAVRRISSDEVLGVQKRLPDNTSQAREPACPETKHVPRSFSQKTRVKETLEQKQMGPLNTTLTDYEARSTPSSPGSMLSTPRELYAIPEQRATNVPETVPSARSSWSRNRQSINLTTFGIHLPTLAGQNTHYHDARMRGEGIRDTGAAERRRIYLPGPVMLAQHPAKLRRDSVATLDPFSADPKLDDGGKRLSDVVGLDGIILFFEEMNVVAEVTSATLDQYWMVETQNSHDDDSRDIDEIPDARPLSVSNGEEMGPNGACVMHSPRASRFSISSESPPAIVPAKRKRNRLRGLLSPGLPGSAFLRSPAIWGHHTENS